MRPRKLLRDAAEEDTKKRPPPPDVVIAKEPHHPSGVVVGIVGTERGDQGRSCEEHLNCGEVMAEDVVVRLRNCLLYTSPSPRDLSTSRMPSSA